MNKESIQNKLPWKGTSIIKGIGSLFDSNQVVNEADESQNEDSILRKSIGLHMEGEYSDQSEEIQRDKVSYTYSDNDKIIQKDRYEENKDESMNQTHSNLLFDTSMKIRMQDSRNPALIAQEDLTGYSKNNTVDNLNSKHFTNS